MFVALEDSSGFDWSRTDFLGIALLSISDSKKDIGLDLLITISVRITNFAAVTVTRTFSLIDQLEIIQRVFEDHVRLKEAFPESRVGIVFRRAGVDTEVDYGSIMSIRHDLSLRPVAWESNPSGTVHPLPH